MKMFPAYKSNSNVVSMRSPTGGRTMFPVRLHTMLDDVDANGYSHIVSWQPHGRCFVVHRPRDFAIYIAPFYFRQTKWTSFQRQLNIYGFNRLCDGPDKGGYYHPSFLRGKSYLCHSMTRTSIKGTRVRIPRDPNIEEPNFYSMSALHAVPGGPALPALVGTRRVLNTPFPVQRRSRSLSVAVEATYEPYRYGNAPQRYHGQQIPIRHQASLGVMVPQVPRDRIHDTYSTQASPITRSSHRMPGQVSSEYSRECPDLPMLASTQWNGIHGRFQGHPYSILSESNPLPDDVSEASSIMSDDSTERQHRLTSLFKPLALDEFDDSPTANQEWAKFLQSFLPFGYD